MQLNALQASKLRQTCGSDLSRSGRSAAIAAVFGGEGSKLDMAWLALAAPSRTPTANWTTRLCAVRKKVAKLGARCLIIALVTSLRSAEPEAPACYDSGSSSGDDDSRLLSRGSHQEGWRQSD
eukprot:2793376-Rhodomonas_salina.2